MHDLIVPSIVLSIAFLLGKLLDLLFSYELEDDQETFEFDNILTSLEGSGQVVQIETVISNYAGTVVSNGITNVVLHTELDPKTQSIARWELDKSQIISVGYYVLKRDDGKGTLSVGQ